MDRAAEAMLSKTHSGENRAQSGLTGSHGGGGGPTDAAEIPVQVKLETICRLSGSSQALCSHQAAAAASGTTEPGARPRESAVHDDRVPSGGARDRGGTEH